MAPERHPDAGDFELVPDTEENGQRESDALEALLAMPVQTAGDIQPTASGEDETPRKIEGIVIGRLIAVAAEYPGRYMVEYPGSPDAEPLPAITTVSIRPEDMGRDAALAFEAGDPAKPIVLGLIHREEDESGEASREAPAENTEVTIERDGERMTLSAQEEIVLRCGKSSITLTRAGKIIIRGAYLLSRSSGVNRIKGGSVQLN